MPDELGTGDAKVNKMVCIPKDFPREKKVREAGHRECRARHRLPMKKTPMG